MRRYRLDHERRRRPFWLPASNYYVLASAVTIAFFFLVLGILHDGGDQTPFVTAGISASILLALAVVLREVILRRARKRFLASQYSLDKSLRGVMHKPGETFRRLTMEQNTALLGEIARKSDAAKVLSKLADAHREVFELCDEYLDAITRELPSIGPGSPRLAAFRRGRDIVRAHHHFHLLQWAQLESRALTQKARNHVNMSERLASAQDAFGVIDFALKRYPHDGDLLASEKVLRELIASLRVSDYIERAERAVFDRNFGQATALYKDALFYLEREGLNRADHTAASEHIAAELKRLELLKENPQSF